MLKLGKYKHFKGHEYEVVTLARDCDSLSDVVVYRGLYVDPRFGNYPVWVRPLDNFLETVEHEGKRVPRFEYIGH